MRVKTYDLSNRIIFIHSQSRDTIPLKRKCPEYLTFVFSINQHHPKLLMHFPEYSRESKNFLKLGKLTKWNSQFCCGINYLWLVAVIMVHLNAKKVSNEFFRWLFPAKFNFPRYLHPILTITSAEFLYKQFISRYMCVD